MRCDGDGWVELSAPRGLVRHRAARFINSLGDKLYRVTPVRGQDPLHPPFVDGFKPLAFMRKTKVFLSSGDEVTEAVDAAEKARTDSFRQEVADVLRKTRSQE